MTEASGNHPVVTEAAGTHAGVPDAFERLWTPHRMVYIDGDERPADGGTTDCPFCRTAQAEAQDGLVVRRGTTSYVVLNLYPYNPGHLLVCPYRHVADFTDLTTAERVEIGELTATAMTVLRDVSAPHGFNLGMNQGAVAGAGIAAHLHQHVVPRWGGDANFFPIIARTKALPQVLGDTRELLAAGWQRHLENAPDRTENH